MSQVTNYTVENAGGATVRADINNILLAVQSNNSGVSAPSTTYAGMLWLETPATGDYILKVRDKGNNHWLTLGVVTDPGSDDEMGTRLLQGAASKTHIKRSDGTVLLAENGTNVATLTNVVLGSGSQPASVPLLAMAASSTGITRSSGTALLTEDGSNVATINNVTLGSNVKFPGAITNCAAYQNSTRAAISAASVGTFFTVSYDKKLAASTLFVIATIPGLGSTSGKCGIGFKYGSSGDVWSGGFTFVSGSSAFNLVSIQGSLAGYSTTGAQTLTLQWGGGTGLTAPFSTINPNATDSASELPTTTNSAVYVWEVL